MGPYYFSIATLWSCCVRDQDVIGRGEPKECCRLVNNATEHGPP